MMIYKNLIFFLKLMLLIELLFVSKAKTKNLLNNIIFYSKSNQSSNNI